MPMLPQVMKNGGREEQVHQNADNIVDDEVPSCFIPTRLITVSSVNSSSIPSVETSSSPPKQNTLTPLAYVVKDCNLVLEDVQFKDADENTETRLSSDRICDDRSKTSNGGNIVEDVPSGFMLWDQDVRPFIVLFALQGSFGYMPHEYAHGVIALSPKIDVYAFGVVLYELIYANQAVINDGPEVKGLVALFDEVFDHEPNSTAALINLVDPRLGDNYSIDSVYNIAKLAKVCTMKDPQLRPSMRSVVVALMTITSTTED
ncbi:hypothetical protein TSUD_415480 [Trifolium subterraneum]|uniref:Protein kinase domain-containing protein n=1 Tax=Trifolium subterraneum TaxID=3900 RepID=A0A2Z6PV19_TRISU|nr:hypothetical protein TSUD_415480 [Trifolium subterraneum]